MELADATLIAAVILGAFAITGILAAWADQTFPLRGLALGVLAGVLAWQSWQMHPDGLALEDVPLAFMALVNAILH